MRVRIYDSFVEAYADDMTRGTSEFPPVIVFFDGETYWLADGFHRLNATLYIGGTTIDCDIRSGTRLDAIQHAIGANHKQGIARTNQDKQVALRAAFQHPDMVGMSDQALADKIGVSRQMVTDNRPKVAATACPTNPESPRRDTRRGIDGVDRPSARRSVQAAKEVLAARTASKSTSRPPSNPVRQSKQPDSIKCHHCNGRGYL